MSIWAQIGDARVTAIPPDGKTLVDIYAEFTFDGLPLPDGTIITFLIGKGAAPDNKTNSISDINLTPIDGVSLIQSIAPVQKAFIRDEQGNLSLRSVAQATILPVSDQLIDNITVAAYSTFDKLGTVKRFSSGGVVLTVSNGQGVFLGSVERYDSVNNVWVDRASMPTGRSGLISENIGGNIFAVGGFNGNFVNVNEEYDPVLDSWTTKTPCNEARAFGASAVISNEIYFIGGYNFSPGKANATLEKYTPGSDIWTTLAPLPFGLAFHTAQAIGTDIWVFYGGTGFDDKGNAQSFNTGVLRYDTTADKWHFEDAIVAGAATGTAVTTAQPGDLFFDTQSSMQIAQTGFLTLNRGGATQETVRYVNFQSGTILLSSPLQFTHLPGESVTDASLQRIRLAPASYQNGTVIKIVNGFDGFAIDGVVETFDTTSHASVLTGISTSIPRYKAGEAQIGSSMYFIGGAIQKSDYSGKVDSVNVTTDSFTANFAPSVPYAKMNLFRSSFGCASVGSFIFSMGGQGNGHQAGWLQMSVTVQPSEVRADGRQTAAVTVSATDGEGDFPPDGIKINVRGLLYVGKADVTAAAATAVQSTTGAATAQGKNPIPTISILPVLFSANEISFVNGTASTTLLPRSEDFVNEVQNLLNFAKGNEVVPSQAALKNATGQFSNQTQKIGERRDLYSIAIEMVVDDPIFFGQTDTNATTAGTTTTTSLASSSFNFNPPSAAQGPSGTVLFYSDITSIPDVEFVTDAPVDLATVNLLIDELAQEIPFGASPHYDAIVAGALARIVPPPALPLLPPHNIMMTVSDNENNGSANSAADAAEELNLVAGIGNFPAFITTVVVTDPISLAARADRTDVADLELISSETGGNSFSLDSPTYIPFIINRIKTSAPSSIGTGSITVRHQISGSISTLQFIVDNMIAGNSAVMTARYSVDGYNFVDLGINLSAAVGPGQITSTFTLGTPVKANFIEYTITLSSGTFNSPILKSVSIRFIEATIQYFFTFPQTVGGQISELAAVTNECVPAGCTIEVGIVHGDSLEFDRDYITITQPGIKERGTIMAINRSFDTLLNGQIFRDTLETQDFIIYNSKSGPWAEDAVTRIFVDNLEVLPDSFIPVPELGQVVFRNKLATKNVVTLEVENQESFRVGLRITNPTLQAGTLDDFAFMYGQTQSDTGLTPNRLPIASNLFITPATVVAGGPMTANYTYSDPDSDIEDKDQTQILWFRNGAPVTELTNLLTVSNSDILAKRPDRSQDNLISRGQQWFFTVRPSDGKSFGPLAVSTPIVIANQPPTSSTPILTSSNANDPQTFTSSDTLTVTYTFTDNDADVESGSIITWTVNGLQVKTGTDNTLSPLEEDSSGNKFIKAGVTVFATVQPSDGTDFGAPIDSNTVTITGSKPIATNVAVLPTAPSAASFLTLTYQFISVDQGPDQSTIAWFANDVRQTNFDNLTQVPRGNLKPGQSWYAIVTPTSAGISGDAVKSNVVLVQA